MIRFSIIQAFIFSILVLGANSAFSQKYLADFDSSLFVRDTLKPIIKKFENIRISGYLQPQFQVAGSNGAPSYNGGNFQPNASNRFMLRRARARVDYFLSSGNHYPQAVFTFQIDATERGIGLRDMFVKVYETRHNNFSLTAGMFARPFGFEINYSSQYREAPERGRMTQILMPSERDLGAMLTYDPLRKSAKNKFVKIDAGVFNGQGLTGLADFDNKKDIIIHTTLKPQKMNSFVLSGGVSMLQGGWIVKNEKIFRTTKSNGKYSFTADLAASSIGKIAPRKYYGADMQLERKYKQGKTEMRIEYWRGTQGALKNSSTSPGSLNLDPAYIRKFQGGFLCFLQNIVNNKNQIVVKYDWYDPNTTVKEADIDVPNGFSAADILFSTLGFGYLHQLNEHLRVVAYYEIVKNKPTQLEGYTKDLDDNIFTIRLHFRF